jgi:hypothetical protein
LNRKSLQPSASPPHDDALPTQGSGCRAWNAGHTPNSVNGKRLSGGRLSPKRARRPCACSISSTECAPARFNASAAAQPAGPAPITATSKSAAMLSRRCRSSSSATA